MATESVTARLNHIAASVDGVASLLQEMVQSSDPEVSRQAFALADLCERNSQELGAIATALGREG
jgi:hypothetical protein